jgi:predicted HNH restriction endonuclease
VVFDKTLSRIEKGDKRWRLFLSLDFELGIAERLPPKPEQNDAEKLKDLARIQTELTKETIQVKKYRRSRELVQELKQLYNYRCQLCSPISINIPQIPMRNGNSYVEVHHIKGFNEVSHIEGVNQEEGDFEIDNYKNAITVCVYHHKLLHKHKDGFSYDAMQKCFVSRDKSSKIPLVLNKHL